MGRGHREALELFVTGVFGIAFLAGLLPFVNLLTGIIGALFVVAALLGALFFMIVTLRSGRNPSLGGLELLFWGILSFSVIYVPMWYFISYLPSTGKPFLEFKLPETTSRPTLTPQATVTPLPIKTLNPTFTIVPSRTLAPTKRP